MLQKGCAVIKRIVSPSSAETKEEESVTNGNEVTTTNPNEQTATFAMGWFWGPDALFGAAEGVLRTRVGYAGGSRKNPTYYTIGDHTESIQIDFDPQKISYPELLKLFWNGHYPTGASHSRQYMSAIFYHNDEQRKQAEASRVEYEKKKGKAGTVIECLQAFYRAEDYHQKYYLRSKDHLMSDLKKLPPREFVDSKAAARMNGFIGGYGTTALLLSEIDSYGLSPKVNELLLQLVRN